MAIQVTWLANDIVTPLVFNDAAEASLEAYRASLPNPPPDILTMIIQALTNVVLIPAFGAQPPADVKAAQDAATAAAQYAQVAMQTFVVSALTITAPVVLSVPVGSMWITGHRPLVSVEAE